MLGPNAAIFFTLTARTKQKNKPISSREREKKNMASDDLFEGLPPPATAAGEDRAASPTPAPPPAPPAPRRSALKSSLKRSKPSSDAASSSQPAAPVAATATADVAAEGRGKLSTPPIHLLSNGLLARCCFGFEA
jgi:hypothetical protein